MLEIWRLLPRLVMVLFGFASLFVLVLTRAATYSSTSLVEQAYGLRSLPDVGVAVAMSLVAVSLIVIVARQSRTSPILLWTLHALLTVAAISVVNIKYSVFDPRYLSAAYPVVLLPLVDLLLRWLDKRPARTAMLLVAPISVMAVMTTVYASSKWPGRDWQRVALVLENDYPGLPFTVVPRFGKGALIFAMGDEGKRREYIEMDPDNGVGSSLAPEINTLPEKFVVIVYLPIQGLDSPMIREDLAAVGIDDPDKAGCEVIEAGLFLCLHDGT
jgi:hypothetical protein